MVSLLNPSTLYKSQLGKSQNCSPIYCLFGRLWTHSQDKGFSTLVISSQLLWCSQQLFTCSCASVPISRSKSISSWKLVARVFHLPRERRRKGFLQFLKLVSFLLLLFGGYVGLVGLVDMAGLVGLVGLMSLLDLVSLVVLV